ncbi:MAG: HDOD domain-containing protein [Desulfovibrio sp.]
MTRILFVDADEHTLNCYRDIVAPLREEWEAHFAASGKQAVTLLKSTRFDVVISALILPDGSGADLLEGTRKLQPHAARLILSAYSSVNEVLQVARSAHQILIKPFETQELMETLQRATKLRDILDNESVRNLISSVDTLPVLPDVYLQIMEELRSKEPSMKRIGTIVESDIGLSATILRLVNSPYFGFMRKIKSPSQGISLLGTDTLNGLVLSTGLMKQIDVNKYSSTILSGVWKHSFRTACYARQIAKMEHGETSFVEACFNGGLLHDVGKIILAESAGAEYQTVLQLVEKTGHPLWRMENGVFKVNHGDVGAYLLGLWGVDQGSVEAVWRHHRLERLEDQGFTPAAVVHVANYIDNTSRLGESGHGVDPICSAWLEKNDLTEHVELWQESCLGLNDNK